jgi:uncharacterized OB-fold protein
MSTSPYPVPNPDNAPFWDGCRRGELLLQRCAKCRAYRHHPRPMCPQCGSLEVEWTRASGRGVVHTFTIVHGPTLPAFQARLPYNVIAVRLDEGVYMVSNLLDCAPEDIRIGMPVELTWIQRHGSPYPAFRPLTVGESG